jgi:hypothetical protein
MIQHGSGDEIQRFAVWDDVSVAEKSQQAGIFLGLDGREVCYHDVRYNLRATAMETKGILFAARDGNVRQTDAKCLENPPDATSQLARESAGGSEIAVKRTHQGDQIEDKNWRALSPEWAQREGEYEQPALYNNKL